MKFRHFALVALAACASGCSSGSVKETLGLSRAAPDEYRVVSRPPLSVPPEFSLRPPSATDMSPGQVSASDQAESLMLGGGNGSLRADTAVKPVKSSAAPKVTKMNAADAQFLQNAGATRANPRVREEMVEERYSKIEKEEDAPWWDVMGMTSDSKDPMVDAKKEAERIQTNSDEGKSVTDGETLEVKGRDTGVLGKWLGY